MNPNSKHAPAERATWETLHEQLATVNANAALQGPVFEAPECILLLNAHRQIVYANAASQQMLCGEGDPATLYGCRPGEAMQCVHATKGEGGCGTARYCRMCGAVNAVLKSLSGSADIQRCSIQCENREEPFECITFSMPVHISTETYALVAMKDASEGKATNELAKHAFAMQRLAAEVERG